MKKLLLVLAAAAAPAWACTPPAFEDCALYSGTCQRINLNNCNLAKLGDSNEAQCNAIPIAQPDKYVTKWCPEQSEDELKFLCEGGNKCIAKLNNGKVENKGQGNQKCLFNCPTYEDLLEQLQELEERCCTCEPTPGPTPGPTTSPTSSEPTTSPTPEPTPSPTPAPSPGPTPQPTPGPSPGPTQMPVRESHRRRLAAPSHEA